MSRRRQNRVLAGLFLLSFLIIFASGCDKYTRHEVLTFFFTGVPPLEGEEKEVAEVKKFEKRIAPEVTYFAHGPYASKQCYQCHVLSPAFSSLKTVKKKAGGFLGLGGQLPGLLVLPRKDLCLECHPPKPVRAAHWSDEAPVSEGNCLFCHDPHQSPFQYMLRKKL